MSIYGTILVLDDEHIDDCGVWVEVENGVEEPIGRCTCDRPWLPLVYQGSHVLPSDDDEAGGWVEMACIPDHVHRDGRDDAVAREGERKPWLRLSVGEEGVGDATVLVTEAQARRMWEALGEWLGGGDHA